MMQYADAIFPMVGEAIVSGLMNYFTGASSGGSSGSRLSGSHSSNYGGRTIYTGPRGGRYYVTPSGYKHYVS